MKKIMMLFSIVAIVAMMGCPAQNEDVVPDLEYKVGVYYKDLGGYVVGHNDLSGDVLIVNNGNLGPYLLNEIPDNFSIEGFNDWNIPDEGEISAIVSNSIYDTVDSMDIKRGDWYWSNTVRGLELRVIYVNPTTKFKKDDGLSHFLRVVRWVHYTPPSDPTAG